MPHFDVEYVEIIGVPVNEDIEEMATMCPLFLSIIDGSISRFICKRNSSIIDNYRLAMCLAFSYCTRPVQLIIIENVDVPKKNNNCVCTGKLQIGKTVITVRMHY